MEALTQERDLLKLTDLTRQTFYSLDLEKLESAERSNRTLREALRAALEMEKQALKLHQTVNADHGCDFTTCVIYAEFRHSAEKYAALAEPCDPPAPAPGAIDAK